MHIDAAALKQSFKDKGILRLDLTIENNCGEVVFMFSYDFAPTNSDEMIEELEARSEDITSMLYLKLVEESYD